MGWRPHWGLWMIGICWSRRCAVTPPKKYHFHQNKIAPRFTTAETQNYALKKPGNPLQHVMLYDLPLYEQAHRQNELGWRAHWGLWMIGICWSRRFKFWNWCSKNEIGVQKMKFHVWINAALYWHRPKHQILCSNNSTHQIFYDKRHKHQYFTENAPKTHKLPHKKMQFPPKKRLYPHSQRQKHKITPQKHKSWTGNDMTIWKQGGGQQTGKDNMVMASQMMIPNEVFPFEGNEHLLV